MTSETRPPLVLRFGITGGRELRACQMERLRQHVASVLQFVRHEVERFADTPQARAAYRLEANGAVQPVLRFLSPLAEGADRLAADKALELGYELHVPMPFAREEYERDFVPRPGPDPNPSPHAGEGESCAEFHRLLVHATSVLELDGGRDEPARDRYNEARSYEAVGRFVVRNCDLLIAIWDGKPGKGRGGTTDTVQFAADFGPPVWWIHAERDQAPLWIVDDRDLRDPKPTGDAERALSAHLKRLIPPPRPAPAASHRQTLLEQIAGIGRPRRTPLEAWYAEKPPRRHWWNCWTGAYRYLLKLAAWDFERREPAPEHAPEGPPAQTWHNAYAVPDHLAADYAARYRSTYVLIFALAALALICAAVTLSSAGMPTPHDWFTGETRHAIKLGASALELGSLVAILALVVVNVRRDWHRRSIDYRLLAELCRKQQALGALGWSLSGRAVQVLGSEPRQHQSSWVVWLFAAFLRAAPIPHGAFDAARLGEIRDAIQRDLLDQQIRYHADRGTLCERAGHSFVVFGELLFLGVIAIVGVELWLLLGERGDWWSAGLGLAAAIAPALAAAAVGIRAYAELELLAEQSHRMHSVMAAASEHIAAVDVKLPLASQDLGAEVLEVITQMLQDVDGWVRLSRVKLIEAG